MSDSENQGAIDWEAEARRWKGHHDSQVRMKREGHARMQAHYEATITTLKAQLEAAEGENELLKWHRLVDDARRWSYEGDSELAVYALRDSSLIKAMGEEVVSLLWAYAKNGAMHSEVRDICAQAEQFITARYTALSAPASDTREKT